MASRRRWTLDDRTEAHYQYVPFDVPRGAAAVRVEFGYDRSEAVLDFGVFDPEGFRGYSGGARTGFSITPKEATPGYLPGELPPGEWNVLIGLYLLSSEGVVCEVSVDTGPVAPLSVEASPPPGQRPSPRSREIPASPGHHWVVGDLHSHTVHSDGALSIDQIADRARRRGLDFLAITDHNTVSHHPYLPEAAKRYEVALIPGQEVTSFSGHANCFGSIGWVNFREAPDHWLTHTEAASGLMSINHPVDVFTGWHHDMRSKPPLTELWHTNWDRISPLPLDWWREHGGIPVGGSDFHEPTHGSRPGSPATFVEVEGEDVLGGLAAGRVALAKDPTGPVMVRQGGDLLAVAASGLTMIGPDGSHHPVRGDEALFEAADTGLHRLVDEAGLVVALTL